MNERNDARQRALDAIVYAPIGIGAFLRDTAPGILQMFVARGKAEVGHRQEQVQERVVTVRSMGQVAVAFGVPMAREKVGRQITDLRARAGDLAERSPGVDRVWNRTPAEAARPAAVAEQPSATVPTPVVPLRPERSTSNGTAPPAAVADPGSSRNGSATDLPIPGYDALSASQVVQRLAGLAAAELEAVREYESTNRNRRTILGKIDQLSG